MLSCSWNVASGHQMIGHSSRSGSVSWSPKNKVFRLCRHQLPAPFIAAEPAHQQRALSGAAHGASGGLVHMISFHISLAASSNSNELGLHRSAATFPNSSASGVDDQHVGFGPA